MENNNMCLVKDRSTNFYIFLSALGFFFVIVDIKPGSFILSHIQIYQTNPEIMAGVILLFFSGFGIGHRTKNNLKLPS